MKKRRYRNVIGIDPKHFDASQIKFYILLLPFVLLSGLPILFVFCNAFKPLDELMQYPPRFYVIRPTWDNFVRLFSVSANSSVPVSRYLFNSIAYTILTVVLTVALCLCTGYMLSKKKFKMKKVILSANEIALMFVPLAVSIPRYYVITKLHMTDTVWVHILPLLAMPVGLFLVKQFMDQIPNALVESAEIDGASDYTIIAKIIYPIVKPALATVALLAFQGSWGAVEASNLYTNVEQFKNFSYYMSNIAVATSNAVVAQALGAAAALIMFVPNIVLFIILQSRVMNTMAYSGIK